MDDGSEYDGTEHDSTEHDGAGHGVSGHDDSDPTPAEDAQRFLRQTAFAPLGEAGQARLEAARVLVVGCGALGGAIAQSLVRSGVGELVLVDRDVVEWSNLPRQVLFDAEHARRRVPKVEAARRTLERIGGPTRIETHVAHLDATLLGRIGRTADLILDGTDNLGTRYLINDMAVKRERPWVYGGVVGSSGLAMAIEPGGPCLRCVFPEPPPVGTLDTCESAGVLQPAVAAVASLQAGLALRLLGEERGKGERSSVAGALLEVDVWNARVRRLELARDPECPCCAQGEFEFLVDGLAQRAEVLCGRNAVQVPASGRGRVDFDALVARLDEEARIELERTADLVRFADGTFTVTVFADGRALVEGTEDEAVAIGLCDRLLA